MKMIVKGVVKSKLDGVRGTMILPPVEVPEGMTPQAMAVLLTERREFIRDALQEPHHKPILTVTFKP